jgi:cytochrome c oxidase subunit 3
VNIFKILGHKPWQESGQVDDLEGGDVLATPSARVGLWAFLAVVASLFGLFTSAYHMRAEYADWRQLDAPALLWFNTLVLVLTSAAFQWAWTASRQGRVDRVRDGMTVGGALTGAFLLLQFVAWRQMIDAGYYVYTNPANAFFYLLTGVHALHLLGGLWVWAKTTGKIWAGLESADVVEVGRVRLRVELCTVYWHFLLLVWLVLFGLMLST